MKFLNIGYALIDVFVPERTPEDAAIMERMAKQLFMRAVQNGTNFKAIWAGDRSDYAVMCTLVRQKRSQQ